MLIISFVINYSNYIIIILLSNYFVIKLLLHCFIDRPTVKNSRLRRKASYDKSVLYRVQLNYLAGNSSDIPVLIQNDTWVQM